MLLRNNGASTLGKILRRPIITTMASFDGTGGLSWDAMRSTFAMFRGGKAAAEDRYISGSLGSITNVGVGQTAVAEEQPEGTKNDAEAVLEDPEHHELPRTTSRFTMSEEVFRAAKTAARGSPESFWTHTLYRGPEQDGVETKVKVHYCRTKHTSEQVLQQYFLNKKVLGFDIEWQPEAYKNMGIKKNVSLVQLASEDRIGLFHLALYPKDNIDDLVAPSLRNIMEDASVTKVGVAIKADCTRLRKYLNIESRGIFELSHLYKLVKFSSSRDFKLINKRLVSLSTQVQEHLHLPMYKGDDVRGSDWSLPLQMDQIVYAASDSYAGVHLFDTLEIKRKELDPTPPRPYNAEEGKPIRLAEGVEIETDEELEPEEAENPTLNKRTYPKRPSPSFYEEASVEMDKLDSDFCIEVSQPTTPMPSTRSRSSKSSLQPKSPLVLAAAELVDSYRSSHPKNKATPSGLRCYFLWYHNPELSLPDIAALLREVPLQTTTVINYILESVRAERLPFEKERLRGVLAELPKEVVSGRYRTLSRACEAEGVGKTKN
ncbi:Werner syndrome ATP-dependent helicase [Hyphodiscus hymeniophilus]|uniref:Werner syndrome ATP-dependent helicase n=1 Tax=Hyphodiscus hymeniophilus TaxID=353542 RepID=A0A9P6SMN1_9HELO|nr:Werner syndrome ATP-dependent helicase [Hyphodiscus hymeniophilus]